MSQTLHYDLRVKAKTPGQPDVLAAANVSSSAANTLLSRLVTAGLAEPESAWITPHKTGVTTDNVNDRNAAHLEVLLAVLTAREAATV